MLVDIFIVVVVIGEKLCTYNKKFYLQQINYVKSFLVGLDLISIV